MMASVPIYECGWSKFEAVDKNERIIKVDE
jgi:hypothetical protein